MQTTDSTSGTGDGQHVNFDEPSTDTMLSSPVRSSDPGEGEAHNAPTRDTSNATEDQAIQSGNSSDGNRSSSSTTANNNDNSEARENLTSQAAPNDGDLTVELDASKKKKKRKSRPGKTIRAVTGFEDFYADTPTTPAEHADEQKLYSADNPFAQRIELAIQRYRQKRRFDPQRSFLFDKYLAIGGIDSSQRMFQGLDPSDAKDMTSEEIRQLTARDVIHHGVTSVKFYDPDAPGTWTVDFTVVVKGFLSRWVPENYPRSDQGSHYDNEQAANLLHNFLCYLQMHDVCPEYNSQILSAKAVCGMAPTELTHARHLFYELQDSFNTAAKSLFCDGAVFEANTPSAVDGTANTPEVEEFPSQDALLRTKKLDPLTQLVIFRFTVMDVHKDKEHLAVDDDPRNIHVESTRIETYQVVSVQRRKKKEKAMVEKLLAKKGLDGKIKPAGTMILRPSMIEHAYSNVPRPDEIDFRSKPTEKFLVDDDVLAKVQPGMKIQLEVCTLNIGVVFIKRALDVRVTFDTLLPQSLMLTWKDPVDNERTAPSVDDPGAEDKGIAQNEVDI